MKGKRTFSKVISVILVLMVLLPVVAAAEAPTRDTRTWTDGINTITFSTPETYGSCNSAFDVIWTSGVPDDWTLAGFVMVEFILSDGSREMVPGGYYPVNQTGDLNMTINYPPCQRMAHYCP